MSKIILSFASLSQGGAERVISTLSKPLADKFDEVIYIMWVDAPVFYQIDQRVKLISISQEIDSNNELERMRWFRSYVRRERPNLVLSFLEPYNIRVLLCTVGLGIKTIVAERNDPRSVNKYWIMNQFEKLIYRLADKILVQTETVRRFFDGALAERTHIIYNPVNLPKEMVGKALDTDKKKRIVSVARLTPQKNHDILIKAFAIFSKTHPDYTLTIYGNGPQGEELKQLADSLGVGDKVYIPGASKTIHQDILDADMMCLVSTREGMSNAMIEAMCLGLPCVCTKVSGAVDLIEDDKNGILIDINDAKMLHDQMCRLADDSQLKRRIGKEASRLYEVLRPDVISKQWTDYLDSLI